MSTAAPDHELFMKQAISLAAENPDAPFAALLVNRKSGDIVATGINQSSTNPTLHGEIAAIHDFAQRSGEGWNELTLYSTAEPC